MINLFIAAFIAIFFVGKSSNDINLNAHKASVLRTIFIFALTFLVLVFYIKINRVATVTTFVNIKGIKEGQDLQGNITDTASILISNKFASGITEKTVSNYQTDTNYVKINKWGGVYVNIEHICDYPFNKLKVNPNNKQYAPNGISSDSAYSYSIGILNTSFPRLLEMFCIDLKPDTSSFNTYRPKLYSVATNYDLFARRFLEDTVFVQSKTIWNSSDSASIISLGNVGECTFISKPDSCLEGDSMNINSTSWGFRVNKNKIGFFSSADVSQYILSVGINSSCPVKKLTVIYDLPVETEPLDSGMTIRTQEFVIEGKILDEVKSKGARFLVKMPTLSNLQLIRSLILTTLLTALVSLLLLNVYYLFSKLYILFSYKYPKVRNKDIIRQLRHKTILPLTLLILFIITYSIFIYLDYEFHISDETSYLIGVGFSTIIIAIVIYLLLSIHKLFK